VQKYWFYDKYSPLSMDNLQQNFLDTRGEREVDESTGSWLVTIRTWLEPLSSYSCKTYMISSSTSYYLLRICSIDVKQFIGSMSLSDLDWIQTLSWWQNMSCILFESVQNVSNRDVIKAFSAVKSGIVKTAKLPFLDYFVNCCESRKSQLSVILNETGITAICNIFIEYSTND